MCTYIFCHYISSCMKTDLLHITYSLEDIEQAVQQFWETLQAYKLFAFSGEMGAGKTTFIHKLCDYLHVQDTVSSPTFALINEYHFTDSMGEDNKRVRLKYSLNPIWAIGLESGNQGGGADLSFAIERD